MAQQPSLFSDQALRQMRHQSLEHPPSLLMSAATLEHWKQRVFQFQQQVEQSSSPVQGTLLGCPTQDALETFHPFDLPQQNIEFWRWPAEEPGVAALYFVIDYHLPLLLYVGETCQANQRWKGVHDCKRYVKNYITAHRHHQLPVAVRIGFWPHAPGETRPRQKLESRLIQRWRSPFNKENWQHWGTPFIEGGKP